VEWCCDAFGLSVLLPNYFKIILEITRNQPSPCHFCLISSGQVASSARLVAAWQPKLGFWAKRDFFWLRKVHVLKHSLDEIFNALN